MLRCLPSDFVGTKICVVEDLIVDNLKKGRVKTGLKRVKTKGRRLEEIIKPL